MTGRFVDALKARTRSMHSASQLAGAMPARAPLATPAAKQAAVTNFARYLAEQRAVHAALKAFPVHPAHVDFVEALDTDLWFLELETFQADLPWVLPKPYRSDYAEFLHHLPVHRLGCHWYNLVFAHLVGGNRRVAEAAVAGALPPNWLDLSDFYALPTRVTDVEGLRQRFEVETRTWTPEQRAECLEETAEAFRRATLMNSLLSR
jgi:hypothetical protein